MAHRRSNFVRSQRRETAWIFQNFTADTVAAGAAVLVSTLNAAALALRPFTIVRTRGMLTVNSDQLAASESQEIGFGMAVVSDQASAIGVTAVPTPVQDMGSDLFFVYEGVVNDLIFGDATGFQSAAQTTKYFDSKAMRKVSEDQDVVVVLESPGISLGADVITQFRMLLKLH